MADEVDLTQEREERMMALRMKQTYKPELEPKGACYFCDEEVAHPQKFCDSYCAEDYEKYKRLKR
jgi:hypothetical protein